MLGIESEAAVFLCAVLTGNVVFICYQILALLRKLFRHSLLAVNLEDFLYWIAVSVYIYSQMYRTTYGSVRWFFILGAVCGAGGTYFVKCQLKKTIAKCKKKLEKHRQKR